MNAFLAIQTTQRSVGYVVLFVVILGGIALVLTQLRIGRREAGSEVELAANRKPYLPDEELEGKKLNLALWSALGLLVVIAVTLPLYWLAEGGRQEGAVEDFRQTFVRRGALIFGNDPLEGAKCESCHGPEGTGAQAQGFVITDEDGQYVDTVTWNAPALNTVLWRFSQAEVKDILTYGRPGTPMQPWGVEGGGALSDQQLDEIIEYLWTIQLPIDEMRTQTMDAIKAEDAGLAERLAAVQEANADKLKDDPLSYECGPDSDFECLEQPDQLRLGEILFNLKSWGSGAGSCARCHVPGFSFGKPGQSIDVIARGRYGPNLVGVEDDLTVKQHFTLVMQGTEAGKIYGANHQGDGRMPGFGLNANNGNTAVPQLGMAGMYTPEQVWAIVQYERNLSAQTTATTKTAAGGPAASTTTTTEAGAK